jgi:hypothetical protein
MKKVLVLVASVSAAMLMTACGGGGGGSHSGGPIGGGGSGGVITYPYETVFGAACVGYEVTPGCTFYTNTDSRVRIVSDPHYNRAGYGSDDLWYVKFDTFGNANVYDDLGRFQYARNISEFAGWVGGTTIGVGTTGAFWENVSGGTYWLGKNGVLYSANSGSINFGEAINNKESQDAADTSLAVINSQVNKELVKRAAEKLTADYGLSNDKATAVASALNKYAVSGMERGFVTDVELNNTFKSVFGVDFNTAIAAVKGLQVGDTALMSDLTDRSADSLGLKPAQAQQFIKGMYRKALADYGFDVDAINW